MNNKEIQEKFEQLASEMDWIKTKLVDLLEEKGLAPVKTSYEVEVPEDIDDYYYVDETGIIYKLSVYVEAEQIKILNRGLAFKTREEAERYDKERILINRAKDWAKKYNEGWTFNLKDYNEKKYFVEYNSYYEPLEYNYCRTLNLFSKLPYFKSEELVREFIKEFGGEIKEVLL